MLNPDHMVRAAQYVRMSTDHQRYSTENQEADIAKYAAAHGLTIVRTYADDGKSGLSLDGRDALKQLLEDVQTGRADFSVILVYDVSRWGRFQDADESAYNEHICKRAGLSVRYCAEQFENDGSLSSTILKGMKRVMAGEYSRELSTKVFAGQCRLIELGFRQGGAAGYGLRRMLVDDHGQPKSLLKFGEHKSIQTDRVVLVPGPTEEIEVVLEIYRMFVEQRLVEREIADILNARGLVTDLGRPWTRGTVHEVLVNEKYIGNNVFNRTSFKLKQKHVSNAPDQWVRRDGAFPAIVPSDLFVAAGEIIAQRSIRFTDEEMLAKLSQLFAERGELSGLIIDEMEDMPSSATYRARFGSLIQAYQLVGYSPDRDFRYIEINRFLRRLHPGVVADVVANIERVESRVSQSPDTDLLTVNDELTISVIVVRCVELPGGGRRWKLRFDTGLRPDITVAVRMAAGNQTMLDYYLLPRLDPGWIGATAKEEDNGLFLDAYRFDSLARLYQLLARRRIRRAA